MAMTPAELERRRTVVGASEAGLLFGLKAFGGKTIADMDYEKRYGLEREWKGNKSTDFGNKFEATVLEIAEERLGSLIIDRQKWVTRDCNAATLDGRVASCGSVIDAKTSGIFGPSTQDQWGDELTDSIPDFYNVQLQAQMLVTGAELAYLAALIGGRGFALFQVQPSRELQAEIAKRSAEFIASLSTDVVYPEPPQLDTLKRIRRQPNKVVTISDDLKERFDEAKANAKIADETKELIQREVLAALGDAEAAECSDGMFTYFQQSRKESFVAASTFRVLRFKKG